MTDSRTAADDCGTLDSEVGDTVYRFGAFELHVRRQLLLHVGTHCTVPTRALAILTLLLEREGEVATKEELIAAAWPSTFVHEANLKVNVAALRRSLKVHDTRQDYIATAPGRGYRLIGPVRREATRTLTSNSAVRRELLPPPTLLIGRADEVTAVSSGVLESRFVTLVGAGGIGKTSVAIAAAHRLSGRFAEGVCLVDLAPITDPQYLASAIVAELGVRSDSEDLLGAAIHALKEQTMLLVLDNCEHLLPSLAAVADRLAANLPKASLLVTSREPLRLSREIVFRLEPLSVPMIDTIARDTATALKYSAVELFAIRAAEASGFKLTNPELAPVLEICRRLDGLPLALELAASQTVTYTAAELLRLLQDRFGLLERSSDGHPRHRTLRATLEWSYGLLSPIEAAIFRALAVYAGTFTIDDAIIAASAIDLPPSAVLEGVANLISKSLLSADWRRNSLHYRLLESTRAFADDQLREDRKCDSVRQRHAEHILASLERVQDDWATLTECARWVPEVRRALGWAFGSNGSVAVGVRLTVAAIPIWQNFALFDESMAHLSRALAEGSEKGFDDPGAQARLQVAYASSLLDIRGPVADSGAAWNLALTLAERTGDAKCRLLALLGQAVYHFHTGMPADAARWLRNFIEFHGTLSDPSAAPGGEWLLAAAEMYLGDLIGARARLERLGAPYPKMPQRQKLARLDVNKGAAMASVLTMLLWMMGEPDAALELVEQSVQEEVVGGHALSLCCILSYSACLIALWSDRVEDAERYLRLLQEQLEIARFTTTAQIYRVLRGMVLIRRGSEEGIAALERAIADMLAGGHASRSPLYMSALADGMARDGRFEDALRTIEEALAREEAQQEHWCLPELLRVEAGIYALQGQTDRAETILGTSIRVAEEMGAVGWSVRAAKDLSDLRGVGAAAEGP